MTSSLNREIRVAIVDDEVAARNTIRLLLKAESEVSIVAECANGMAAVDAIRSHAPDLLFLDIQMPEMDGFEVLNRIGPEAAPVTIFVTAYDQYAIDAFRVHALDYLLKPYTDEQFRSAMHRAKGIIQQRRESEFSRQLVSMLGRYGNANAVEDRAAGYIDRVAIKSSGRIYFLPMKEVDWIEASDQYVLLHCGKQSHLMRQSMNYLETRLDPCKFLRIHRSSMVNIQRVKALQFAGPEDCLIVLEDATKLRVSRSRRVPVQQALFHKTGI